MLKVIGSDLCSDTREAKDILKSRGIDFEYVDIMTSLEHLKEYLLVRDTEDCYKMVRESHGIGIPCFVQDSIVTFDIDEIKE